MATGTWISSNSNYSRYTMPPIHLADEPIISNVTECLVDTLFSHNDTGIISSVEVQIIGYVNGSATIKFENGADRWEEVYLADSVRYVYMNEWYDNGLIFIYTPHEDVSMGNIRLEYKF